VKTNLADRCRSAGRRREAKRLLREADELTASATLDAPTIVQIRLAVACAHHEDGELTQAEKKAAFAAAVAKESDLPQMEVRALELQGQILDRRGRHLDAVHRYDRALGLARARGLRKHVGNLLNRSAKSLFALAQYSEAERRLEEALSVHHGLADVVSMGADLLQFGMIYARVNQCQKAMACFARCHQLAESVGDKRGVAAALANAASIHSREPADPQSRRLALDMLGKAARLLRGAGAPDMEASILTGLGHARWAMGERRSARRLYVRALGQARLAEDQHAINVTMGNVAMADREMGNAQAAVRRYRRVARQLQGSGALEEEAHIQHQLGLCFEVLDDPRKALQAYLGEVRRHQLARSRLADLSKRRSFLNTRLEGFEKAIRASLNLAERWKEPGYSDFAFLLAEEARWHEGRERLGLSGKGLSDTPVDATVSLKMVQRRFRRMREHLFSDPAAPGRVVASFFVGRQMSVLFTLRQSYEHVCAELLPWDHQRISAILYSPRVDDLDVVPDVFGRPAQQRWRIPRLFLEFSGVVLAELRKHLTAGDLLVIVPHAHLNMVPWAALMERGDTAAGGWRFLIEDCPVVLSPSLYLVRSSRGRSSNASRSAVVVGDPEGNLPWADAEARAVAGVLRCEPLLGANATKHAVLEGLVGKSIVHLACHSTYVGLDSHRTALRLANAQSLSLAEFSNDIDWNAREIVVLSACSTGARIPDRGDNDPNMISAVLASGCESVIASLWPVDDDATATIMSQFYRGWLEEGLSKAVALQHSMRAFLRTMRMQGDIQDQDDAPTFVCTDSVPRLHPSFWAPFQLWGGS
jgi:tetratricopeptide (TPR) repeat protein